MCVAIAVKEKIPNAATLELAEQANKDGGGIAWVHEGRVRWRKGLTASQILHLIEAQKITPPMLLHFRIATSGGKDPKLCHPFPVSRNVSTALFGNAERVLAHNGHWAGWYPILDAAMKKHGQTSKGIWSDTRAMAWLAKELGSDFLDKLSQKIVTLDAKGNIIRYGYGWHEIEGNHYSNLNWQPRKSYTSYSYNEPRWYGNSAYRQVYSATAFTFWDSLVEARREAVREKIFDKVVETHLADESTNKITNEEIKRQTDTTTLRSSVCEDLPDGCSRLLSL